jgi:beta-lactamase regulating signal transducer with metallopeptidase domain
VLFGPSLAYFLWLLVPTSLLVPLLPAPSAGLKIMLPAPLSMPSLAGHLEVGSLSSFDLDWMPWLICAWGVGALLFCLRLARQQRRFIAGLGLPIRDDAGVLRAAFRAGSPVVVGIVRPKIVVPSDFATRYASEEQALILAHERMHVRRGDLIANAMWALVRCIFWFNPLMHIAAQLSRFDQELACDAAVMRKHPKSRKPYATAMLRAQCADAAVPLGCYWPSTHPLKERIMLLARPPALGLRQVVGQMLVGICVFSVGYGTWIESGITLSGDSARANFSDSVMRISTDDTATRAAPLPAQNSTTALPLRLPPGPASAPADRVVEQPGAAALTATPKDAIVSRTQLLSHQIYQCVIDGQRVYSDAPCGENASIRRVRHPNSMAAASADSYAQGEPNPQYESGLPVLTPPRADDPTLESSGTLALERGRFHHPHPVPKG